MLLGGTPQRGTPGERKRKPSAVPLAGTPTPWEGGSPAWRRIEQRHPASHFSLPDGF
jgi:hypothetical protein